MLNKTRLPYTPTLAAKLRRAAAAQHPDAVISLDGVDAETLRLVADRLDQHDGELASLAEHSTRVHRALCEAIDDLDTALEERPAPVLFVFVESAPDGLTPRQFADLAAFLLDEAE